MIKPLPGYLTLKEEVAEATKSGIILADEADIETPPIASIVDIGGDITIGGIKLPIKVGDRVLFKRHLFDEVSFEGEKVLIGQLNGLVAVIHA